MEFAPDGKQKLEEETCSIATVNVYKPMPTCGPRTLSDTISALTGVLPRLNKRPAMSSQRCSGGINWDTREGQEKERMGNPVGMSEE